MKVMMAIPVVLAKTLVDFLFGTDQITEFVMAERNKAQLLMVMGRTY